MGVFYGRYDEDMDSPLHVLTFLNIICLDINGNTNLMYNCKICKNKAVALDMPYYQVVGLCLR